MIIESTAPARVDLAGGTIDIPPLFLFHEGAATVNFAIDLKAKCRIETNGSKTIVIRSIDRGIEVSADLHDLSSLKHDTKLELPSKLVYFFKPETGFTMTIESAVPAGAGLAGSSTLAIAIIGALNKLVGDRYPPEKFISIAANIETQVIRVPAGFQDYHSAQYGGLACIHFRPDGIEREALSIDRSILEDRIVVIYTGEPRNSGTNNWEITKRHIDGDKEIFEIFEGIRDTSLELRQAILDQNWVEFGEIIDRAHPARKRLSPNITTPQMDNFIEIAMQNGAIGAKVCGAGGGGCIAFFCEDGRKKEVEAALSKQQDVEILDWKISESGLTVDVFETTSRQSN